MTKHYRCELKAFSFFVPENRVTNDDLAKNMDTSDQWISERTGIRERRFADTSAKTSDLAIAAVEKLFKSSGLKANDFDYIIAGTLSPDHYYPGIAPTIQHKLGFPFIPALDIRVQCSAFVYGLNLADALIKSGQYKRILMVFSDVQSKFLDFTNRGRNVSVLFSDGAAAVVCEAVTCNDSTDTPTAHNYISGVIETILGSDGSGTDALLLPSPGTASKTFITHEDIENGNIHPKMDGRLVFKHAVNRMCETATELLKKHNLTANDIACLIPHQANMRISEYIREKINLPPEKVFNNIECYGNTTSATIPICFAEAIASGRLKKGDLVLCVAFGAGFTWGGSLIRL